MENRKYLLFVKKKKKTIIILTFAKIESLYCKLHYIFKQKMFHLSYLRVNKNTIPLLSLFWFCNYPVELKKQYCMVWNKWINEPIWSQCQMWHHNGQTVLLWPCKKTKRKKKENVRVPPLWNIKLFYSIFFFSFLLWLAFSIQKESWSLSNDCKWNNFFSWLIM